MSALTEKVAREHRSWSGISCDCGYTPGLHESLNDARTRHLIEATEAATRAAVAAEIRAVTIQFDNSGCTPGMDYLLSEAYDKGLRVAARIAEGKQP